MTEQEYLEKSDKLKQDYSKEINLLESKLKEKISLLAHEFVFSNNPYKIGDIITDEFSIIKIQKFKYCVGSKGYLPNICFIGIKLTKKLTIKKSGEIGRIWNSNVVRKLK